MTTESVAPAPDTTKPDIGAIVRRLRDTFATGRTRSIDWRKQQLRALEKLSTITSPRSQRRWPPTSDASPSRRG